jgi:hypothetical protein
MATLRIHNEHLSVEIQKHIKGRVHGSVTAYSYQTEATISREIGQPAGRRMPHDPMPGTLLPKYLAEAAPSCESCPLAETRTHPVGSEAEPLPLRKRKLGPCPCWLIRHAERNSMVPQIHIIGASGRSGIALRRS